MEHERLLTRLSCGGWTMRTPIGLLILLLGLGVLSSEPLRAQTTSCGSPPVIEDGTVKREIDGKASILKTFTRDALKGQVEIAKNDVLQRYPNADELRLNQYFLYAICLQVMNDTKI